MTFGPACSAQFAKISRDSVDSRKQALFIAALAVVSTAALIALEPLLTDRELKEHLIFVLSQKHDSDAVTRMIEIAKTEPDRELR